MKMIDWSVFKNIMIYYLSEDSPILEATQWWSFHIPEENKKLYRKQEDNQQVPLEFSDSISFQFGVGDIQMEVQSVWDNIQWDDLDDDIRMI